MHKPVLAGIAVVVVAYSLYALNSQAPPSSSSDTPPAERSFTGKILVINLKSDIETSTIIENATIRRSGGREFLVGTCVDSGDEEEWRAGLPVWTALDDISQMVEMPNRQELEKRFGVPDELTPSSKGARRSHAHDRASTDPLPMPMAAAS